jgi:hypothetical protein
VVLALGTPPTTEGTDVRLTRKQREVLALTAHYTPEGAVGIERSVGMRPDNVGRWARRTVEALEARGLIWVEKGSDKWILGVTTLGHHELRRLRKEQT